MISKSAEYAVKAMTVLRSARGPLVVRDIALAADVPHSYLSKVLHTLGRAGLVAAERGPKGGFSLGRSARAITVYDIVSQFDQLSRTPFCFLRRPNCQHGDACKPCARWLEVWHTNDRFLRETTLESIAANCILAAARPRRTRRIKPS